MSDLLQSFFDKHETEIYEYMAEFYPSYPLQFYGFFAVYQIDEFLWEYFLEYKDNRYNRIGQEIDRNRPKKPVFLLTISYYASILKEQIHFYRRDIMSYDTLKSLELREAVNNFKKAMQAQRVEVYANALQRKGKTLYTVNRSRQATVTMTIGK